MTGPNEDVRPKKRFLDTDRITFVARDQKAIPFCGNFCFPVEARLAAGAKLAEFVKQSLCAEGVSAPFHYCAQSWRQCAALRAT
jgi:hypothetical protein